MALQLSPHNHTSYANVVCPINTSRVAPLFQQLTVSISCSHPLLSTHHSCLFNSRANPFTGSNNLLQTLVNIFSAGFQPCLFSIQLWAWNRFVIRYFYKCLKCHGHEGVHLFQRTLCFHACFKQVHLYSSLCVCCSFQHRPRINV